MRCKDAVHSNGAYVIVLDDTDIEQLLIFRDAKDEVKIDKFMMQRLDELIM
jgi:hypothetical protein